MKIINKTLWTIVVSFFIFTVLTSLPFSKANNEENNTTSNAAPAKQTDLSKEEQILLQKLRETRREVRTPRTSHGPMKDGLAAFLICERKQFKVGEPIPAMHGIIYGVDEKHMTVQPPFPAALPRNFSWFSITVPDGKDVPYTGPSVHFVPPEPKWAMKLRAKQFCGIVNNDVGGRYKLDTPGSYTIRWHYNIPHTHNIPHTSDGSWWHGYLDSNKIQIEIVK